MKKNELDDFIEQKTKESGLTDVKIKKKSVQQRVYRKRLLVARHPGPTSPMKPVEEYIVSILNQMANMRQALCVSEGLALANALIEGTEWEKKVIEFKKKRGWNELDDKGNKKQPLGKKWYKGFFKRNSHSNERTRAAAAGKPRTRTFRLSNQCRGYVELRKRAIQYSDG